MFYVYILKSETNGRYYIGHTGNLENRLRRHNGGLVRSTKSYRPWKVIFTEKYKNKNDAYRREFEIKSYKGGNSFKKLVNLNIG